MQNTLNIDINLIKRYSGSKRRKELFAFAIWCHIQRVNAVVFGITPSKLRKELSIGKLKAERLISDAIDDELFEVSGSIVKAGTFRDKTIKYTRKQRRYQSAIVKSIRFDTEHKYTLKELYDLINEILATFPIAAQEDKDCLSQRGGTKTAVFKKTSDAKSRTLTLKKFSQNLKMSVSSCSRIMKRLVSDGKVAKSPSILFTALRSEHREQILESLRRVRMRSTTFSHNGLSYIIVPCSYSIASRGISESFKHKIYNYHKTYTHQPEYSSTIPQLCGF